MTNLQVTVTRSPDLSDAEASRRLAMVYDLIIQAGRRARQQKETTSRGEFGDPDRLVVSDAPTEQPDAQGEVYYGKR